MKLPTPDDLLAMLKLLPRGDKSWSDYFNTAIDAGIISADEKEQYFRLLLRNPHMIGLRQK